MVLNINKSDWDSGSNREERRRIRWNILRSQGASDKEARQIRDWKYDDAVKYNVRPTVKRKRVSYRIKGVSNKKDFWKQLSSYWQLPQNNPKKQNLFNNWNPWQKKASEEWNKQAININKQLWENMSSNEKKLLRLTDVESHSQGYVAVYRHNVLGRSWENSLKGLEISPWEDPFEDVS